MLQRSVWFNYQPNTWQVLPVLLADTWIFTACLPALVVHSLPCIALLVCHNVTDGSESQTKAFKRYR
jgi:hypothetical protein